MVGENPIMETSFTLGNAINLAVLIVAIVVIATVYRLTRTQRSAYRTVANCEEALKIEQEKVQDLQNRLTATNAQLTDTNAQMAKTLVQLDDARNSIRVLNGSMLIMMDRLGIPAPESLSHIPRPIIRHNSSISLVGIWAHVASLATLDLRADLEGVLSKGHQRWNYRPLVGNVKGADLEQELLLGGNADILYCASHADDSGVYFSDQKYRPEWFADVATRYGVKLVFLNACRTTSTARTLKANGIQSVVYALRDVPDKIAIEFAKAFFVALANGNTVRDSVESGRRSVTKFDSETPKSMFGFYGDWSTSEEVAD